MNQPDYFRKLLTFASRIRRLKSADKLSHTQSTITLQMKQLKEELALKLFEKIGRRMELTQARKNILLYVDTILKGVEHYMNPQMCSL